MKFYRVKIFFLIIVVSGILLHCKSQTPTPLESKPIATVQSSPTATDEEFIGSNDADNTAENSAITEEVIPTTEAVGTIDTVRILVADEITTLDPYRMVTIHPESSVAAHLWDTLTVLDDNLQIKPHLATSWRLINNFTWEIELRQGISFHNGEPLNAEAVRFSIERSQSMPDSLETFVKDISLKEIKIIDDYTLQLTTDQPVANLPYYLAFLEILPPDYYSEIDPGQSAVAPVGSGPFSVSQWTPGNPLVLEAVSTYWLGPPTIRQIIFETVPLAEERLAALRLGEATLVTDIQPLREDQLHAPNSRLEVIESTQRMFIGIYFEGDSPLANKLVRQALNYGINVKEITDTWLEGYGDRYGSWVNPPEDNRSLASWPYDPELARDLLAQAGYRQGFTTTLLTPIDVYYEDVAISETIAQQLIEIGVTVEVETADWPTYVRKLISVNPPPLFLLGLTSYGNGLEDTANLSTDFPFNPAAWRNKSFEDAVSQAASTFNESARTRLLAEAQSIAYEEAPWIWLWRQYDFYGVNQDLQWTPRRDGLVFLYKPAINLAEGTE